MRGVLIFIKVKKYKFEKSYLFSFSGYSQARVILVDTKNKNIYSNKSGKTLKKLYKHLVK